VAAKSAQNSVHYFIIFGGNAESLQQAAAKTENNSQVERHTATDLDCLAIKIHC